VKRRGRLESRGFGRGALAAGHSSHDKVIARVDNAAVLQGDPMSPAEKRIQELLERWLASLEAHREFAALDDDAYWRVRQWVEHERPNRWIIDIARQKTLELKAIVDAGTDDTGGRLAEALELMAVLANLVGAQNLRRFIPLVDAAPKTPAADAADAPGPTADDTQRQRIPAALRAAAAADQSASGTNETPEVPDAGDAAPSPSRRRSHHAHARTATRQRTGGAESHRSKGPAEPAAPTGPPSAAETNVISDAVRLLKWGRSWHELPDAIARMSGRPSVDVIRQILRQRRTEIEAQAATSE
jgi:hypothetical protein